MPEKTRLVVCGPGLIGKKHIELIRRRDDCVLVGVVGPGTQENIEYSLDCGFPLYQSIEAACDSGVVDAVIISSPNAFHSEQALVCIRRGLPVLVEKPLTDSLDDAAALVREAETRGVAALVGHHRTYSPLLSAADRFLHSDAFGRMVCMQGSALFYKPAHYFMDGAWRTKKGGGPILINLIHEIGLMRHFCGEIRGVYAMASNRVRQFEVEDTVAICIDFCSGALGTFILSDTAASSKSWEMTSGENSAYPHHPTDNCYHFSGTRGSLDFPSLMTRTYAPDVDPSWWKPFDSGRLSFSPQDPLALQLEHFLDVVRGEAAPLVSLRDGYANMQVIEAIGVSIAKREPVLVENLLRMSE